MSRSVGWYFWFLKIVVNIFIVSLIGFSPIIRGRYWSKLGIEISTSFTVQNLLIKLSDQLTEHFQNKFLPSQDNWYSISSILHDHNPSLFYLVARWCTDNTHTTFSKYRTPKFKIENFNPKYLMSFWYFKFCKTLKKNTLKGCLSYNRMAPWLVVRKQEV